jgi:hypothetical protein
MSAKRLGVLSGSLLVVVLLLGAVQAGAAGSTLVLKFRNGNQTQAGVGFNVNDPNATPPIGSSYVVTIVLHNAVAQLGKPSGARVGRVLLDCTILSVSTPNGDGICSGIVHLPDGYLTFGGNGGFSTAKAGYFAITGGVGAYAKDRGEIMTTHGHRATVTLYS